jgi:hypothetical protein
MSLYWVSWRCFSIINQKLLGSKFRILELPYPLKGRQDTQHNDIQHYDNKLNDIQHNDHRYNDSKHNDIMHNDIMHNDIMHNDIMHNNKKMKHST